MHWITPHHRSTEFPCHLTYEHKLAIFSQQTLGWQLEIADTCINGDLDGLRHSGYAVLHIVFSYFEMISAAKALPPSEVVKNGQDFAAGVLDTFPELENLNKRDLQDTLRVLYGSVRCGLYHQARTRQRVVISSEYSRPILWDSVAGQVLINPHRLVPHLIQHFQRFICTLRDPSQTAKRADFEAFFDKIMNEDPLGKPRD